MGSELNEFTEYIEILEKGTTTANTIRSYRYKVGLFLDHFQIDNVSKIDELKHKDLLKYQNYLLETGLKESSVNAHFRDIHAFVNFLIDCALIKENPLKKVKFLREPEVVRETLTDEEVAAMIKNTETTEGKLIIALLYAVGVRRGALVNIRRSDIFGQKILFVEKRKKQRLMFIEDGVYELLNKYLSSHNSEWVFPSSKKDGEHITTETVRLRIKNSALAAGIDPKRVENISPHTMRRSFATYHLNDGENGSMVQEMLGHKDYSTTQRYAKIRNSSMDRVLANHKIVIE